VLRRLVVAAGILGLAAAGARAEERPFPHFGAGCVRADFASGGQTIRAERCGPASGRRAVIVLHGCGGFSTFDHTLAADLPRFGITTLDVDYFEPTPPPGGKGYCSVWTDPRTLFATWERVAVDATRSLRPRFARVGAVGWSLGAGVAIQAAESSHAFDAVAAFSALAYPSVVARAKALPPTIFLDGGARDIVRPSNARALYTAAKRAHVPTALYIYGDGTHNWRGRQGEAGRARAASFLRRYL
jgi:dienelactone hydrolase